MNSMYNMYYMYIIYIYDFIYIFDKSYHNSIQHVCVWVCEDINFNITYIAYVYIMHLSGYSI